MFDSVRWAQITAGRIRQTNVEFWCEKHPKQHDLDGSLDVVMAKFADHQTKWGLLDVEESELYELL